MNCVGLCFTVFSLVTVVWCHCGEDEIRCIDGTCIPLSKVRDNINDCPDGKYDETGEPCSLSEMHCANGTCIERLKFQDGVNDCGDNSDEVDSPCMPPLFSCTGLPKTCIERSKVNDGRVECPDASDEAKYLGDACAEEDCGGDCTCGIYTNHSICINNSCVCKPGYRQTDNNHCIPRTLTDPCDNDTDCSSIISGAICSRNNQCTCDQPLKPGTNDTCIPRELNDACIYDVECSAIEFAHCDSSKLLCSCLDGYYITADNSTTCMKKKLNDTCFDDIDCSTLNNSVCLENEKICACKTGYVENVNRTDCRPKQPGDSCEFDKDCSDTLVNSKCVDSTCVCELAYLPSRDLTRCVLRRIGDTCQEDLQCSEAVADSSCLDNMCNCPDGYVASEDKTSCNKRVIYSPCESNSQCTDNVIDSHCDPENQTCRCNSGLIAVENNTVCIPSTLGDPCTLDTDCSDTVPDSLCHLGTCRCISGFIGNLNGTACNLRFLGDPCDVNTDCSDAINNTHCFNDTCYCGPGFKMTLDSDTCEKKIIGDDCLDDFDCGNAVEDSKCGRGRCKCKIGFVVNENGTACIRRRIFDKTCTRREDCSMAVANSNCVRRQCKCNMSFYPTNDNQNCTRLRIGDKHCKHVLDCATAVHMSTCEKGECKCNPGYMAVDNGTVCQKRMIGDPCAIDKDCFRAVFRSVCTNDTCSCNEDNEPVPDLTRCVHKPLQLTEECTFEEQCTRLDALSTCGFTIFAGKVSGITTCRCKEGYRVRKDDSNFSCHLSTQIGDYCEDRTWCYFGDNSYCVSNKCTCLPGHIPEVNNKGCVKLPVKMGDYCRTNGHCLAISNSSMCHTNNTCQCTYKFKQSADGSSCIRREFAKVPDVPTEAIGAKCDIFSHKECFSTLEGRQYTLCRTETGLRNATCMCVPGYASKYNSDAFHCQEVQTYYFNINISLELGCDNDDDRESPLCYKYQPIRVLSQYNNDSRLFAYIRDRLTLAGIANLFNDTPPRFSGRYVNSEVINITEVDSVMRVGILIYLSAEYFNVINETDLKNGMMESLIRHDGEIGTSRLKVVWPFEEEIEWKDFDECTEQSGRFSDCYVDAWCLNTRVSYMCSCKHGFDDMSLDSNNRPGRACSVPQEITTDSLSCSDGKCENQWEYITLSIIGFILMLFIFIGYEIYSRKKKLEKSDIYYKIQKAAKKARMQALRERRKTIKRNAKEAKKKHLAKWQDIADAEIADEEAHANEGHDLDDEDYDDDSDYDDSYYTDDDDDEQQII